MLTWTSGALSDSITPESSMYDVTYAGAERGHNDMMDTNRNSRRVKCQDGKTYVQEPERRNQTGKAKHQAVVG